MGSGGETNPSALLAELRAWGTPDMIWTTYDGERMWFKRVVGEPPYGKTECCYAEGNIDCRTGRICVRHRMMSGLPPPTLSERVRNWMRRAYWRLRGPAAAPPAAGSAGCE
jgi:hypothetical protein